GRFLSELNECGAGAFASCKGLNTLSDLCSNSQTDEPTELGMQAFSSCTALKEVTFKGKWDYRYAVMAFFGCSSLSVAVLSLDCGIIPDSFMEGCSALTQVICRKKMPTHIGERAFAHCRNLKKIDLHRVAEVREKGMYETGKEELRLPSVKNIEKQAFAHILPLQKVFIGEKLQSIDGSAFDGDEALSELEILADDFSFTDFSGIQPKSVAGRSLDFLTEMVFRNGDNLQNLYVDEDVFTPDFRYFIHKAGFHLTKSDKKGYVLLTYTPGVPDTEGKDSHKNNPYRFYVGKDVGLTQENDYLLIFPDSCGYDDEKKEYYIAEGSIRYYASDIREITVRHL
ncbi:MAG: leucine-rich repeat domain-containing protein, partial [Clostridia bacterium]|nr:leucine-rich repeat domain-containing protein [Clostridia bacterium]